MKSQNSCRRLLALLLACLLSLACAPETLAADAEAQAQVMQLMRTEGTVTVSNSVKKSLTLLKNMRLYNGYHVATDEASYAWVNLDSEKLLKMDAVSEISVRKNKKKLDVLLDSGNLFFNVTKPLEDDELLTIRTSTMAVGIRGTCGWVEVNDQRTMRVSVLEGTVSCSVTDPVTGQTKTESVSGGQTAVCTVDGKTNGDNANINILALSEADVNGFALVELTGDSEMCDKIFDDSGIDLRSSDGNARLAQDEADVHARLTDINTRVGQQDNTVNPADVSSAGNTNNTNNNTSTTVSGPSYRPSASNTTVTLTMPQTASAVNEQLAKANVRSVVIKAAPSTQTARGGDENTLEVDSPLTVPAGKTLTLEPGVSLAVMENQTLSVAGNLTVGGTVYAMGGMGTLAPAQGAVIRAKAFDLNAPIANWTVSETADNNGYYSLTYSRPAETTFTVTFHANGGAVTPANAQTGANGKLASLPVPTREGYTFNGWFTAMNGGAKVTENTTFNVNTVIYAQWTQNAPATVTVTFNANGGTVSPLEHIINAGNTLNLPTPTRDGFRFDGWFTENGINVTSTTPFNEDTTLYARWTEEAVVTPPVGGDNWSYDEATKTLTITGSGGPMEDYTVNDVQNLIPWAGYSSEIEKVVITGVTNISHNVFQNCTRLTSVEMPDNITSIDFNAFSGCSSLASINIPDSVTRIGGGVFRDCSSLTSVVIPNGVTKIAERTFQGCSNLTSVRIPSSVVSIGLDAFNDCSSLTEITLPGGVTTIEGSAFEDCSSLTSINIPDGVTKIGDGAFSGCESLPSFVFPDNIDTIEKNTFEYCSSLTSFTIPNGVTTIGYNAFWHCSGITSFIIPNSVTSIGDSAFYGCTSLTDVYYSGTQEQWDSIEINRAFNYHLLNATIHFGDETPTDNVTWEYNSGSKTLYFSGSGEMSNYSYDRPAPWSEYADRAKKVSFESGVTSIGNYAFAGFDKLESCEFGTVTSIGEMAFYECTGLPSVGIPYGVTTIGNGTFSYCSGLNFINIPVTVTLIEENAFNGCDSLAYVYYDGTRAQWNSITIESYNEPLTNAIKYVEDEVDVGEEGWLYQEAAKVLYIGGDGPMEDYSHNTGVYAPWYDYRNEIERAVILDGVTTIGSSAFAQCSKMISITIPETVVSIGEYAFAGCRHLPGISIPDSVTEIAFCAFESCSDLTSVVLPSGLSRINERAFAYCSSLNSIDMPDSVTVIDKAAFYGAGLTSLTVPAGVTEIKDDAFVHNKLESIDVASGNTAFTAVDGVLFSKDRSVLVLYPIGKPGTSYDIPASVTTINGFAFAHCALTSIELSGNISELGRYVFAYSEDLSSVTLSEGITSIGEEVFCMCNALETVTIPGSVGDNMGSRIFYSCDSLTTVIISEGVTKIGTQGFWKCRNLTSIYIPKSVTEIRGEVFSDCDGLSDVYYAGTEAEWNNILIGPDDTNTLTTVTIHYNSTRSRSARAAGVYTDIPAGAWYADAAEYCREKGLMNGTSATEFSPDATLTRAMLVTVLHRLAGEPETTATAAFSDVTGGKWYSNAVNWANGEKIVLGFPDGSFGVDIPVTHEQVGLIFERYSGQPDASIPTDKNPASRAEIAVILMNYGKNQNQNQNQSDELALGELSAFSAMDIMCGPNGITAGPDGTLIVTDVNNKRVWKVLDRNSTAYAGAETVEDLYGRPAGGYHDAGQSNGYFKEPWAVAPFLDGWAVSDAGNNVIRYIHDGKIDTLAPTGNVKLSHPTGLAAGPDGSLYVADTYNGAIRKITPDCKITTAASNLKDPTGLCWSNGTLYIAETGANRIVKLTDGKVSAVAGSGADGDADGSTGNATFSVPQGVAVDADGNIYVADTGNGSVRKIQNGKVTTVVQGGQNVNSVTSPVGLLAQNGRLFICDEFARKVFVLRVS